MSLQNMSMSVAAMFGFGPSFGRSGARAAVMTPFQRQRAFEGLSEDPDIGWDLIAREHRVRASGARILHLFGEVLRFDGAPMPGALVEIRQADMNGRFPEQSLTTSDFRGVGRAVTDFEGRYQFRTILPMCLVSGTAHIAAQVTPDQGKTLSTQLYLMDHPGNETDWDYQALGPSRQAAVSLDPIERADGDLDAGFNFVL